MNTTTPDPLPTISMAVFPMPSVPGFEVSSTCGRKWFVPLEKVREDYARFLVEADGLTMEEALAKADENKEFLRTWFCEQFIWEEVEGYGVLLAQPTPQRLKEILDFYRDNFAGRPSSDYIAHDVPK